LRVATSLARLLRAASRRAGLAGRPRQRPGRESLHLRPWHPI